MKKILFTILVSLLILLPSCKEEEEEKPVEDNKQCNCGTIANDGIDSATNCYWLEIRNECSGNKKKFCFDEDIWTNNFVGDRFCVTNVTSW